MQSSQHLAYNINNRKEKARIAARARRSQEADIIMDMANELHITQEKMRRIDKATIVKLAIDYIKAYDILCRFKNLHDEIKLSYSSSATCIEKPLPLPPPPLATDTTSDQVAVISPPASSRPALDNIMINNNVPNINNTKQTNSNSSITTGPLYSTPKLSTASIFSPKTEDMNSHFLVVKKDTKKADVKQEENEEKEEKEEEESTTDENDADCKSLFVLKPDTEIEDEDDLTHLAPCAGESVIMDVEPLDGIMVDISLFTRSGSPPTKKFAAPIVVDLIDNSRPSSFNDHNCHLQHQRQNHQLQHHNQHQLQQQQQHQLLMLQQQQQQQQQQRRRHLQNHHHHINIRKTSHHQQQLAS